MSPTSIHDSRARAIAETLAKVRQTEARVGVTRPALVTEVSSLDRIGSGFIAVPWRPVPLVEPESLIERELAAAVARAHQRVASGDMDEAEGGAPKLTFTQSGSSWDALSTIDQEDRHQRMRMIAEVLPDRVGHDVWKAPEDQLPAIGGTPARRESGLVRTVKEVFSTVTSGHFFTRDRVAIGLAILLGIGLISHLQSMRK